MPIDTNQFADRLAQLSKCRIAIEGEDEVKSAGETMLPNPGKSDSLYAAYKQRAIYLEAPGRTKLALKGMVTRKPAELTGFEEGELAKFAENIDDSGNPFPVFIDRGLDELLTAGGYLMLLDAPQGRAGLPYVSLYPLEQVIWYQEDGQNWPVDVRVLEYLEIASPDDPYTTLTQRRIRRIFLDNSRPFHEVFIERRKGAKGSVEMEWVRDGDVIPIEPRSGAIDYLPVVYRRRRPPLLPVVNLTLAHYSTSADHRHGLHFTGLPTPIIATRSDIDNITVGSVHAIILAEGSQWGYLSISGEGMAALAEEKKSIEGQLAVMGARMLEPQKLGIEAAETLQIRASGEGSALADLVETFERDVNKVMDWAAEWLGQDRDKVSVRLNREFLPHDVSPAYLSALFQAFQGGAAPLVVIYQALKKAGKLPEDMDFDGYKDAINTGMIPGAE